MMRVLMIVVLVGVIGAPVGAAEPLDGFDDYVKACMKEHEVPGLAIAIVKDDKVILSRGYGTRTIGKEEPVTDKTLFAIASVTKAMTAATLGTLVDEGKLGWDDPVIRHLTGFMLSDPYMTRELTIRDLLCHRTGYLRHDGIWFGSTDDRDTLVWKLRLIKPDHGFRSKYAYQNLMFLTAGQVAAAVGRKSWDELLAEKFFKPLAMYDTITSIKKLPKDGNIATPHELISDKLGVVPWRPNDHMGPAGSVISHVDDMARWLRFQLGDGSWQKKRLLTSGTLAEMHTPQSVIRLEGPRAKLFPESKFACYGLGWILSDFKGKKVVEHGGSIDGFISQVGMIPEEKLGIVVLCNHGETQLPRALMYAAFDRFLGTAKPRDWSAEMKKVAQANLDQQKEMEKKDETQRIKETKPSRSLAEFAGTYDDQLHTPLVITHADGKLTAKFLGMTLDMEHWHYDTFRMKDQAHRFVKFLVTFQTGSTGKLSSVQMNLFGEEISMNRVASLPTKVERIPLTEEQRQLYVGKFECKADAIECMIESVGKELKLTIPGQAPVTMIPVKEHEFVLAGALEGSRGVYRVQEAKVLELRITVGDRTYNFTPRGK